MIESKVNSSYPPSVSIKDFISTQVLLPAIKMQEKIAHTLSNIFEQSMQIQINFEHQKKQNDDLVKSILQSFFQSAPLFSCEINWDLDTEISLAKSSKEQELKLLKKRQMKKMKEKVSEPKYDIISYLEYQGSAMPAIQVFNETKFNGNIDEFYADAKRLHEKGDLKWELIDSDSETPQSIIYQNDNKKKLIQTIENQIELENED